MGERKFCYKCMEKYDDGLHICPHCGYDETTPANSAYITPGTLLHDRYLVGILLEYNGEGATYVGYDVSTGCKILLREYMPINLCTRVKGKATISVNYNDLAKYKAFMAEYTELNKSLARLRNDSNINPVLDMFAENNTTYTVFEHIDGVKMLDFLKENAGELSWEQVSKLFPPLFTTIGRLHNAGIIHRAISPDTVYITTKGELRLSSFCISAVRTADAGLEYELFKGYAAPEQYSASSSSRQGSWTDVYSICALIYRALTGCMPDDSVDRTKHDDLHEPHLLNPQIPQHVSRVIMDGMNLNGRDRIQTITELVTRLFEHPAPVRHTGTIPVPARMPEEQPANYAANEVQPEYNIRQRPVQKPVSPVPPPQPVRNYVPPRNDENDGYRYEKVNTVDRIKIPIIIAILLLAILLIIIVVIFNILGIGGGDDSSDTLNNNSTVTDNVVSGTTDPTATTLPDDIEMPDLERRFFELTKEKYQDSFVLDPEYEYNDEYDTDMIFEQDIEPGTMISKGTVVTVKVSKGKESAIIPDYADCTVSEYKNRLEKAGISDFNYQFIASKNSYGKPNSIIELQVEGKTITVGSFFSNKEGKKLTVYYVPEDGGEAQTTAYSQTTEPVTTQTTVATTAPITTTPPVTEPPVTDPPVTDPPVTDPPATTPPMVTDTPPDNPEFGEW